jgi:hypothetical protein
MGVSMNFNKLLAMAQFSVRMAAPLAFGGNVEYGKGSS